MTLRFELVQPGEYDDYYYEIFNDDDYACGVIDYNVNEWVLYRLHYYYVFNCHDLIQISNKLNELNAATKADKLFGVL